METINLQKRGTLAVMEWLAYNNAPTLMAQIFACNGEPFLIVSSESKEAMWARLETHPLKTWDDFNDNKRLTVVIGSDEANEPAFYFNIQGKFYFATIYHK